MSVKNRNRVGVAYVCVESTRERAVWTLNTFLNHIRFTKASGDVRVIELSNKRAVAV